MTLPPELRDALDDLVRAQQAEADADEKYSALYQNRHALAVGALTDAYQQCDEAHDRGADASLAVVQVYRRLYPSATAQSTAA